VLDQRVKSVADGPFTTDIATDAKFMNGGATNEVPTRLPFAKTLKR